MSQSIDKIPFFPQLRGADYRSLPHGVNAKTRACESDRFNEGSASVPLAMMPRKSLDRISEGTKKDQPETVRLVSTTVKSIALCLLLSAIVYPFEAS